MKRTTQKRDTYGADVSFAAEESNERPLNWIWTFLRRSSVQGALPNTRPRKKHYPRFCGHRHSIGDFSASIQESSLTVHHADGRLLMQCHILSFATYAIYVHCRVLVGTSIWLLSFQEKDEVEFQAPVVLFCVVVLCFLPRTRRQVGSALFDGRK